VIAVLVVVVSGGRREVYAHLQPRLPHHADGSLERLPSMARTDASGLPARQLAGT